MPRKYFFFFLTCAVALVVASLLYSNDVRTPKGTSVRAFSTPETRVPSTKPSTVTHTPSDPYEPITTLFTTPAGLTHTTKAPEAPLISLVRTAIGDTPKTTASSSTDFFDDTSFWDGLYASAYTYDHHTDIRTTTSTPDQKSLHDYGNAVGEAIATFELTHNNQTHILSEFLDNRSATKDILRLASDYMQLGESLSALPTPSATATIHTNLHEGYTSIGTLLAKVSQTKNDEALVDALLTYNKAAERVGKAHIDLTILFSASGVTFERFEPGFAFMFPALSL